MELNMSKHVDASLILMMQGVLKEAVGLLSTKYDFDDVEACEYLNVSGLNVIHKKPPTSKIEKLETPRIPLPFCGEINDSWCQGVRLNHGLYTQCTQSKHGEGEYCKTCQKQADAKEGKPTYGSIQERAAYKDTETYRDCKGKQAILYGNVMDKLGISRDKAEAEAARFGWTIPECQFSKRVAKKGRPTKVGGGGGDDPKKKAKGRGRPRKQKKVLTTQNEADDLIASLMKNAEHQADSEVSQSESELVEEPKKSSPKVKKKKVNKLEEIPKKAKEIPKKLEEEEEPKKAKEIPKKLEEEESSDTEDVNVDPFEHEGKSYLKDSKGNLYDYDSHEQVGYWDDVKGEWGLV